MLLWRKPLILSGGLILFLAIAIGEIICCQAQSKTPDYPLEIDYSQMLRELKPTLIIEVSEKNLNSYLQHHTAELKIPEGFHEPRVTLRPGVIELSVRKRLLLFSARVYLELIPSVVQGRLCLKEGRIRAGAIPVPFGLHLSVAEKIEGFVNTILAHNETQLDHVEVERKLLRAKARVRDDAADIREARR